MKKVNNVLVIADSADSIEYLASAAAVYGENTTLVYGRARECAKGAAAAYYVGELQDVSFSAVVPQIAKLAADLQPELVLTKNSRNGRLVAGTVAAVLNCHILTDVSELTIDEKVTGVRMVYGGAAFKTEHSCTKSAVICLGDGLVETQELPACENITDLAVNTTGIRFTGKRAKEGKTVNLTAAKKVVCVGRGVASEEVLGTATAFADHIEAVVGCTRPIAEELKWLPRETYIGVSGIMIKPQVYIGIGISGQVQHMVGVNQSGTVFAINKDKNAPIFKQCDYGLIADLEEAIPALTNLLS